MEYPIVLHKDKETDYGVMVPDLPGCFSAGETVDIAVANAKEAIECHLEGLMLDKEPLPMPSDIDKHRKDKQYKDGLWALISIDLNKISGQHKRVNITLPKSVLNKIDKYTMTHGSNRSAFLVDAALQKMAANK